MMNRAINHLVLATVDSLTKFKNKLAYYLAIFAMVFGSTFGTFNTAHAVTLSGDATQTTTGVTNGVDVIMSTHALAITSTTDASPYLTLGELTATTGNLSFITTATASPTSFTIDSFTASGTSNVLVTILNTSTKAQVVNVTGNLSTLGTLGVTAGDASTDTSILNIGGNLTAGATTLTKDTATATLAFNGATAQSVTTVINGSGANSGILNASNTSGGVTFNSAIGTTNTLTSINVTTGTATFDGAIGAVASTITGTATFGAASAIPTVTIAAAGTTTLTGVLTATTEAAINGILNVNVASQAITEINLNTGGTIVVGKALTNGLIINTGGTQSAAGFNSGGKMYLPANLTDAQTLIIADSGLIGAGTDAAVVAVMQDTALSTYSAVESVVSEGVEKITITSTNKSAATTASELSVNTQQATALFQARDAAAAANAAATDTAAIDGIFNALNAQSGLSATADTDFANQVAPQTDTISGSAIATRAMTGTVQGIVSNRMASLRSGDAFVTGMSAGNGMSANSGFIQAFGSEAEQKNTGPTTAKVYGYDSSTSGLAIGFDGMTDNGSTVGLSASFSTTDVDGKGTGKSKNAIDSYTVSVYADKATENGYIEGSLTYGINDNTSSRLVNTAGLSRTYKGEYDSEQISLKVGGGVPNEVIDGTFVTPFASATGTLITTDSYTETSTTASDALRLKIAQDDINSLVGTIGVKAHMITDKGTPMISFAINNEFGDTTINSTNTYTGGGTAFNTSTDVEELSATLGLGYSFGNDVSSVNIGYEANANEDDYLSHYGTVKIISKF